MRKILVLLLAAASIAAAAATSAGASSEPVRLGFDKSAVAAGVWQGAIDGHISGGLTTVLTDLRVSGPISRVPLRTHPRLRPNR